MNKLNTRLYVGFLSVGAVLLSIAVVLVAFSGRRRERVQVTNAPNPIPTTPVREHLPSPVVDAEPDISNVRIGGIAVMYPRVVPLLEMNYNTSRFEFVPGAVLPGLDGRRVEDASHIIITTYPGVVVRAVDQTEPLNLEVRRDRITLTVDPYTRRVVTARVG